MGKSKILLRFTLVTWEGLGGVCVSEIIELGIGIFLVWEVFRKWKTWAAVDIVWTIMAK